MVCLVVDDKREIDDWEIGGEIAQTGNIVNFTDDNCVSWKTVNKNINLQSHNQSS